MQKPTASGINLIDGGFVPAKPLFGILWNTPGGELPVTKSVSVVFSVTFGGLPARDYTVTKDAKINDQQYEIPSADMTAFANTLLSEISANLVQPFDPKAPIVLDGPVKVHVTPNPRAETKAAAESKKEEPAAKKEEPAAAKAKDDTAPSAQPKRTSNNLTIVFQRVLGKPEEPAAKTATAKTTKE